LKRKLHMQKLIAELEKQLQKIRIDLGELKKNSKPGELYDVPTLPQDVIIKSPVFNKLKGQLLVEVDDAQRPPLLLEAPSGMGKSVMASAVARNNEIRTAFPDGIFWITLGRDADLLTHQRKLIKLMTGNDAIILDVEEGTEKLREIFATTTCLLIFDDVTDAQDILPFNVLGEYCQILLTSSNKDLFSILQYFIQSAQQFTFETFNEATAVKYFMSAVNRKGLTLDTSPINLVNLVKICEYLPAAIKLTASVARQQPVDQWKTLLQNVKNKDFDWSEKHPHVLTQALFLNVEELGEQGEYYLALAVFADYNRIPQKAVTMLWHYLYQLLPEEADDFINGLAKKGLLEIHVSKTQRYLRLHTYQYDYLVNESDVDKLHTHLLAAYRRTCGQHGWMSGPKDGYFFDYLCWHLYYANRKTELKLLLLDFDWMESKLQATQIHALLNDYELLEDKEIEMVKQALYNAAYVLMQNKEELANQLLDHLWGQVPEESKGLQALLHQAQEKSPDWHWEPPFPEL